MDDRLAFKSTTFQMKLENVVDYKVFGSFAKNFRFLPNYLKTGEKHTSNSVIFMIDEFDLFFSHNQTLLYNFFDILQSAQAQIYIIGKNVYKMTKIHKCQSSLCIFCL